VSTLSRRRSGCRPGGEGRDLLRIANLYRRSFPTRPSDQGLEAALDIDPDNPRRRPHLKAVYEKRRDWENVDFGLPAARHRPRRRRRRAAGEDVELAKLASDKLKKAAVSIAAWSDVLHIDPNTRRCAGELEKPNERKKQWKAGRGVRAPAALAPTSPARPRSCRSSHPLRGELNDNRAAIDRLASPARVDAGGTARPGRGEELYLTLRRAELEQFFADQGKLDEYVRVLERRSRPRTTHQVDLWGKDRPALPRQLAKSDSSMRAFERVLAVDAARRAAEALIPL